MSSTFSLNHIHARGQIQGGQMDVFCQQLTCNRIYELNLKDGDIPLSSIINSEEYKKATYPLVYDDDYMEQLKPGKNADFLPFFVKNNPLKN